MVDAKVAVTATAKVVVARSSAVIRALTTGVTAKAVLHRVAHVRKVAARAVVRTVADKEVAKIVTNTMATNCHATLTP